MRAVAPSVREEAGKRSLPFALVTVLGVALFAVLVAYLVYAATPRRIIDVSLAVPQADSLPSPVGPSPPPAPLPGPPR